MPHPDAITEIIQAAIAGVMPDEELRLDDWSERHVVIPRGGAFEGPYRLSHTPYARRILQALSPGNSASIVVARVASQMLKTQIAVNAILGWVSAAPANILALEPTDGLAKRLSARIAKAIEACDAVRDKVAAPRSRDKRNTIDAKEFDGGTLYITTAGSDANLAEIPARYLFCDEIDREGWKAGDEGNRIRMALARLTTYEGISKAYLVSSPTIVGASEVDDWFELGTQEEYHVPCPHCGHLHTLIRENFRWQCEDDESDVVVRAWFVCPECGSEIDEHQKTDLLPAVEDGGQARWVAKARGNGEVISVWLPAYYAPLGSITWKRLAGELLTATRAKERGDDGPMMVYQNTREGLSYEPGEVTSTAKQLQDRARAERLPARVVPDRALILTAFADTQDNRLEVVTEAWGPGMERWTIDRHIIFGNPSELPESPTSVWAKLDQYRRTPFAHASGAVIYISAYGIDSGGHHMQDVYNYGGNREQYNCTITRGHTQRNRPIIASKPSLQDIDWNGRKVEGGVKLWMLGTDTAKDWIFNRLRLADGPGAMHWYADLELEAFEQLLVEKPHVRYTKGRKIREYIKPNGARNEMLDCAVGNLAMAFYLGLHRWSNLDWSRLRDNLIPLTADLFATAAAADLPKPEAQQITTPHQAGDAAPSEPPADPLPTAPTPPATTTTPLPKPAMVPPPMLAQQPAGRRVLSRGMR